YLAVSMILYFVSNKIALKITGLQIMEHGENYDTMGQLSGSQLIEGIMHCYKSFFKMPFKDVYATNPNNIVRITFLLSILVIAYAFIVVMISKKSLSQKILIGLVVVVLPLTINLVYIMAISSGVMYTIMAFDIVFMLLIGVAVLEATGRLLDKEEMVDGNKNVVEGKVNVLNKAYKPINATFAIALIGTILSYIWFANGNYLAEQYTNNHDAAYYQVLMTQIKSIDGYEDGMAVALLGKPDNDSTNSRQSMIGDTFNIGGKMETNVAAYSSWNIMTRVLGFDPLVRDSDEDEEFFKTNPEVMEMPCYPADGSIKIIDGTVVIKFED
ncbi:MAG: hypothetical protein Q4D29_11380, partial [Lachnospiraceae bacterium]|nr:hypothetical protein [Lachnospiraceae bacterium]